MRFLIIIDGQIGSGKSTVINNIMQYFGKEYDVGLYEENVNQWLPRLIQFYNDSEKYNFQLQLEIFSDLYDLFHKTQKTIICERSFDGWFNIFIQNGYQHGKITQKQYQILKDMYQLALEKLNSEFMVFRVFLNCNDEICLSRIQNRNRQGEQNISIVYLQELSDQYKKQQYDKIIDASGSIYEITIELENCCIQQIQKFHQKSNN